MSRRVLIVDDEPDFTMMVELALTQHGGYETRQELDARNVVATAREFEPDLVLLDVMMPDMDGGEVAARLAADPRTRQIPVVFVTALAGGEDMPAGGYQSGGRRFLPKPVDFDQLMSCINETIERARESKAETVP